MHRPGLKPGTIVYKPDPSFQKNRDISIHAHYIAPDDTSIKSEQPDGKSPNGKSTTNELPDGKFVITQAHVKLYATDNHRFDSAEWNAEHKTAVLKLLNQNHEEDDFSRLGDV